MKKRGADDRPDQSANAAHHVIDHRLTGGEEVNEVGRGEFVLDRVKHARQSGEQSGQHDRDHLEILDAIADGARARLVLADRLQHHAERRLRYPPQDQIGAGDHRENEPVHGGRGEARVVEERDPQMRPGEDQAVFAAGHGGPGKDDDVENLAEDQRRDGKIDVAKPRGEVGDEQGGARGAGEPEQDRQP